MDEDEDEDEEDEDEGDEDPESCAMTGYVRCRQES